MALMNVYISPWQVIWPRVGLIIGLSLIFAPLNVAAFMYTPRHLRAAAVGLLALLRNEGGSVGTSVAETIQERRLQFHLARIDDTLNLLNPNVPPYLSGAQDVLSQNMGDPTGAQLIALQTLDNLRQAQAASFAYFDVFWVFAMLAFVLIFLVLLMKRSVAEKGAHVAAE
jgi:DHA2 family multidrug resistance protein